jgi:hypothetical protein
MLQIINEAISSKTTSYILCAIAALIVLSIFLVGALWVLGRIIRIMRLMKKENWRARVKRVKLRKKRLKEEYARIKKSTAKNKNRNHQP